MSKIYLKKSTGINGMKREGEGVVIIIEVTDIETIYHLY
jgi:hypothetical protein